MASDIMEVRSSRLSGPSSRILYDIPCRVCQDHSSGKHYGIFACDGCAGFFKRSIRRSRHYLCKAKVEGTCVVDKTHRNQCRACRLKKCVQAGMNKEAVQHERGPRNSTLRRQMSLYFSEPCDTTTDIDTRPTALDLALPRVSTSSDEGEDLSRRFLQPTAAAAAYLAVQALMPKIAIPQPLPVPSTETICESAARILFMNVKWAKSVAAFTRLPHKDQLLLLEESWRELFVLSSAQFQLPLEIAQLLLTQHANPMPYYLLPEVQIFQEIILKFKQLQLDAHEFACLRAIVLFKPNLDGGASSSNASTTSNSTEGSRVLEAVTELTALQDATQATLNRYVAVVYPTQPFRFGKLLLQLPSLRAVTPSTIEELFFRRTIGNIPIERIICDMYKAKDM